MDTNNVLEIRDLHVIYETDQSTVYAVNGVNLTVTKGKTLGLVGDDGLEHHAPSAQEDRHYPPGQHHA